MKLLTSAILGLSTLVVVATPANANEYYIPDFRQADVWQAYSMETNNRPRRNFEQAMARAASFCSIRTRYPNMAESRFIEIADESLAEYTKGDEAELSDINAIQAAAVLMACPELFPETVTQYLGTQN